MTKRGRVGMQCQLCGRHLVGHPLDTHTELLKRTGGDKTRLIRTADGSFQPPRIVTNGMTRNNERETAMTTREEPLPANTDTPTATVTPDAVEVAPDATVVVVDPSADVAVVTPDTQIVTAPGNDIVEATPQAVANVVTETAIPATQAEPAGATAEDALRSRGIAGMEG